MFKRVVTRLKVTGLRLRRQSNANIALTSQFDNSREKSRNGCVYQTRTDRRLDGGQLGIGLYLGLGILVPYPAEWIAN